MTLITGSFYTIDKEKILTASGTAVLTETIVYDTVTYLDTTIFEFVVEDGQIVNLDLPPNTAAIPNTSHYQVILKLGNLSIPMNWIVLEETSTEVHQVLVTDFDTNDILYENDPRILALLTDLDNNDVPDVLEGTVLEQLDFPSEAKNSINTTYTTIRDYHSNSLIVFLNGIELTNFEYLELGGNEYEIFVPPDSDDDLVAQYEYTAI